MSCNKLFIWSAVNNKVFVSCNAELLGKVDGDYILMGLTAVGKESYVVWAEWKLDGNFANPVPISSWIMTPWLLCRQLLDFLQIFNCLPKGRLCGSPHEKGLVCSHKYFGGVLWWGGSWCGGMGTHNRKSIYSKLDFFSWKNLCFM